MFESNMKPGIEISSNNQSISYFKVSISLVYTKNKFYLVTSY